MSTRISKVRTAVLGLSKLAGTDAITLKNQYPHLFPHLISPATGLTDAVRRVLEAKEGALTPIEVRTALREAGYDTEKYKNILASIHTILKRLLEAGEVTTSNVPPLGTAYKWKNESLVKTDNWIDSQPVGEIAVLSQSKSEKFIDPVSQTLIEEMDEWLTAQDCKSGGKGSLS